MAKYTENFNLIKPEDDEYYDVADFNENMDIIDEELAAAANSAELADKIGNPGDTGQDTVFGCLSHLGVKSIQRKVINFSPSAKDQTVNIEPVNVNRCIVISERLGNIEDYLTGFDYVLSNTTLRSYINSGSRYYLNVGFWIVEFY